MGVSVFITSDPNEIKVKIDGSQEVQKRISTTPKADTTVYYSTNELLDIGSYLHQSTELQDHIPHRTRNLGWTLYHKDVPPHSHVAESLLLITNAWHRLCDGDSKCVPLPEMKILKHPILRKLVNK